MAYRGRIATYQAERGMMEDENIIYADSDYTLSLKDMADALDRISRSTQVEDTPLPFDPDDYPVVVTPPKTRTHRLWRILAFIIEAFVIAAILGIWVDRKSVV